MKTSIKNPILISFASILLLLSINSNAFGQTIYKDNPSKVKRITSNRITPEDISKRELHYSYNQDGNIIAIDEYRGEEFESELWQKEEYRYLEGQLTFSKVDIYKGNQDIKRKLETDFLYHDTCLVEEIFVDDYNILPTRIITTYDSLNCKILSEVTDKMFSNSDDFQPSDKIEWIYDEKEEEKTTYRYSTTNQEYQKMIIETTYYNEDNLIESQTTNFFINNQIDSSSYYYDLDQDYASYLENFQSFDGGITWTLYNTRVIEVQGDSIYLNTKIYNFNGLLTSEDTNILINHQNEKGLLERTDHYRTTYYGTAQDLSEYHNITFFKYDCQDRLLERVNELEGIYLNALLFEYDDDLCDDYSIDIQESISITPNPSSDYIFIEGELIGQSDVQIELVTLSGKSIPIYNEKLGLNRIRIPIDFLPVGVYVINAKSGDKQAAELFIRN